MKQFFNSVRAGAQPINFAWALFFLLVITSCTDQFDEPASPSGTTLASIISANNELNIFTAAMSKANLLASLDNTNSGEYTVFAPHDSAFLAYFQSTTIPNAATFTETDVLAYINSSMSNTSVLTIGTLAGRLNYYVVSSKITASGVTSANVFNTLGGSRLSLSKVGTYVYLNSNLAPNATYSSVSGGKIVASAEGVLGVVHTINKVITAPSTTDVLRGIGYSSPAINYGTSPATVGANATDASDDYDLFAIALKKTGVCFTVFPNAAPLPEFTIFAPKDVAFKTYLATKDASVTSEAAAANYINSMSGLVLTDFTNLIKYHIVQGRYVATDLLNGTILSSLYTGKSFTIDTASGIALTDVNGSNTNPKIVSANNLSNAGIFHGIDGVLLPN